jgi:murein DD-endopeptidase MepM/ murein hydrolase activator NlpD
MGCLLVASCGSMQTNKKKDTAAQEADSGPDRYLQPAPGETKMLPKPSRPEEEQTNDPATPEAPKKTIPSEDQPTPTDTPAPPAPTPPPDAPKEQPKAAAELPFGKPVPGKKGFVTSPYDGSAGIIDVRDIPPGTKVRDPYTGKVFRVP